MDLSMIKEMQKHNMSEFQYMFKKHLAIIYEDTNVNYSFRQILIDVTKQKFLSEWVTKFISQIKNQVITSIVNKETNLKVYGAVILNDNYVNRMFGWLLFKMKKIQKTIV